MKRVMKSIWQRQTLWFKVIQADGLADTECHTLPLLVTFNCGSAICFVGCNFRHPIPMHTLVMNLAVPTTSGFPCAAYCRGPFARA